MRKFIPYGVRSIFLWTLGITLFVVFGVFVLLGFSCSSYLRLAVAILSPALFAVILKTLFAHLPRWFNGSWIAIPLFIIIFLAVGQWIVCGTTFSHSAKNYGLEEGNYAGLPIYGAYARFEGDSIVVRRSFFHEEAKIILSTNDPKAIGISLFGDRIAVRFHESGYPGGKGYGTRVFFDTETGEVLGSSSLESGYWHGPLYLVW
jgi:hypothetical protein